eukprot:362110-Chlamydomonas_euryale.AAC.3
MVICDLLPPVGGNAGGSGAGAPAVCPMPAPVARLIVVALRRQRNTAAVGRASVGSVAAAPAAAAILQSGGRPAVARGGACPPRCHPCSNRQRLLPSDAQRCCPTDTFLAAQRRCRDVQLT